MSWGTMDTAPRDGTVVDLMHKSGCRVTDVWWDEEWIGFWGDDAEYTHWTIPLGPDGTPIFRMAKKPEE